MPPYGTKHLDFLVHNVLQTSLFNVPPSKSSVWGRIGFLGWVNKKGWLAGSWTLTLRHTPTHPPCLPLNMGKTSEIPDYVK